MLLLLIMLIDVLLQYNAIFFGYVLKRRQDIYIYIFVFQHSKFIVPFLFFMQSGESLYDLPRFAFVYYICNTINLPNQR